MPPQLFTQTGLFRGKNIQVTSGTVKQARSESIIAANPANPFNLIAASKKFSNPQTYRFTIGVRVSFTGGSSWLDATLPVLQEWGDMVGGMGKDATAGMTDPAVAFTAAGHAFFVGEPIKYQPNGVIDTIGMFIYKSTDGGLTWSQPTPLHVGDTSDDKSWIACDNNPSSPHFGNIYVAWGAASPLRFARSTNDGASWTGVGNSTPGTAIADGTFAPEITVGLDGTVHIVWHPDGSTTIEYMRSTDGGETFEQQKTIVNNVHSLRGSLPEIDQWPHFPGANFRVITVATGCAFALDPSDENYDPKSRNFVVAWSDYREQAARIYYRTTSNAGASFDGPANGQPVLPAGANANLHHFHPQLIATGGGVIGCAYYEYGPKNNKNAIDVLLSASFDQGSTFPTTATVTEKPWDPAIDAPFSHGDPNVTFIGDYFGLDADGNSFDVLWTDTRTGVQELFFDSVATTKFNLPDELRGIYAQILFGVVQDGGGAILVNGHIIRVPPRGPDFEIVNALAALSAAGRISGSVGRTLTKSLYSAIGDIARAAGKSLQS